MLALLAFVAFIIAAFVGLAHVGHISVVGLIALGLAFAALHLALVWWPAATWYRGAPRV